MSGSAVVQAKVTWARRPLRLRACGEDCDSPLMSLTRALCRPRKTFFLSRFFFFFIFFFSCFALSHRAYEDVIGHALIHVLPDGTFQLETKVGRRCVLSLNS